MDQLENELALAKAVIRRDLAQCRIPKPVETINVEAADKDTDMLEAPAAVPDTSVTSGAGIANEELTTKQLHAPDNATQSDETAKGAIPALSSDGPAAQSTIVAHVDKPINSEQQTTNRLGEGGTSANEAIVLDTPDEIDSSMAPSKVATVPASVLPETSVVSNTVHAVSAHSSRDANTAATPADTNHQPPAAEPQGGMATTTEIMDANEDDSVDDISSLLPGLETYANAGAQNMKSSSAAAAQHAATAQDMSKPAHGDALVAAAVDEANATSEQAQSHEQPNPDLPFEDFMDLAGFDMADMAVGGTEDGDDGAVQYDDSFFNL